MTAPTRTPGVWPARVVLVAITAALAALDLGLKAWAEGDLSTGQSVDLGVLELRLAFNPGVAFSLGHTLPSPMVLGATGLIIAGLVVFAWRATPAATMPARLALAAILGGAIANLADRAPDGVVTDYLHTGWFPTFNLADTLITLGAGLLIITALRHPDLPPTPKATPTTSNR